MIHSFFRTILVSHRKPRASGDDPVLGDLFTWLWT